MDFRGRSDIVEVIEEGRIVRVSEDYARREGLPILRKNIGYSGDEEATDIDIDVESGEVREISGAQRVSATGFSGKKREVKKNADWKEKQVVSELIDNFHWHISHVRRQKGLLRKQFADAIGESEEVVKKIENGVLPDNSFVLVNKIQSFLGVNLRKDRKDFSQPMRELVEKKRREGIEKKRKELSSVIGDDIEVVEG